jgi:hypothetical protein
MTTALLGCVAGTPELEKVLVVLAGYELVIPTVHWAKDGSTELQEKPDVVGELPEATTTIA